MEVEMKLKVPLKMRALQIISEVCYYLGLTYLFRFYFTKKNKVIVLMYHRIFDIDNCDLDLDVGIVAPKEFERQIEYISKNYNAISFDDLMKYIDKKNWPKNPIIVTIDDGYKDCYTNAYPILQKYKVPATFFLATDYVDSKELYWWDKIAYAINKTDLSKFSVPELGTYTLKNRVQTVEVIRNIIKKLKNMDDGNKKMVINELLQTLNVEFDGVNKDLFLTWDEIKKMSNNGMYFDAHTCSHLILTKVPYGQAEYEIINSKSIIEHHTNKKVNFFSYPNGTVNDFDETTIEKLKFSGFKAAVTTIHGTNKLNGEIDLYTLKRIDINANINTYLFKLELTDMLDSLYWIRKKLKRN